MVSTYVPASYNYFTGLNKGVTDIYKANIARAMLVDGTYNYAVDNNVQGAITSLASQSQKMKLVMSNTKLIKF